MKYDEKASKAAQEAFIGCPYIPSDRELIGAISAYCEKAGVVMVNTRVLGSAANCITDLGDGKGGWAYEEVAEELRDIIRASQEEE